MSNARCGLVEGHSWCSDDALGEREGRRTILVCLRNAEAESSAQPQFAVPTSEEGGVVKALEDRLPNWAGRSFSDCGRFDGTGEALMREDVVECRNEGC